MIVVAMLLAIFAASVALAGFFLGCIGLVGWLERNRK